MTAALIAAFVPLVQPMIEAAARAANASREQEAAMLKAALEYIRAIPEPRDAALAPDYAAAKEAAMVSPPLTLSDADVESDRDPYASDR